MDLATKRAYIRLRLERAQEDLLTARDDLERDHWRGAANRAYYTIFHTASAALLWLDVERARHSGVQAAFGEYLVKPGIVGSEFGAIYSRARKLREEQDYDLDAMPLTREDAEPVVEAAERFLERVKRFLAEAGATEIGDSSAEQ